MDQPCRKPWVIFERTVHLTHDRATNERTGPMTTNIRYIGLDVHKETIVIAVADAGRDEVKAWKTIH